MRTPVSMKTLLWIATASLTLALAVTTQARRQPADSVRTTPDVRAFDLGSLPLLFADDSGVAARHGVVRALHAARTRPAPVLEADRPWEGDRVYIYGSVQADATGALRMWYMARPLAEVSGQRAGDVPELRAGGFDEVLYATSRDGVRWEKPSLGLYAFKGSRDNNIVFDLHSPSVLRDAREPDPARRYKMLGALQGNYYAAFSADGLHWTSYPHNPVLAHSDTITLAQDPRTGEYLAYHKRPATVRGFPRRVVWLSRSRDFQAWSEPELVFAPDERDDAWTAGPQERTEVYNMSVFAHAAGFLGLPTVFRVMTVRTRDEITPGQSPLDGPIDVELATSADGRAWARSSRREVMIPRGAPGAFDGGAILGVSSAPVSVGDETWVYYTALTTGHGAPIPPKRISIGRAEWRRDGFVSLDAGPDGGRVETRPLRLTGSALIVNADASFRSATNRGRVRVALLEADGRPIAGFALDDAEAIEADVTQGHVRWRGGAGIPTDRPVRVVVELTSARLFSLSTR